ncbi:MAG: hypothetical protein PHI57_06480 [Bacteroidales bacterium]|nr:hypothetical protein [Bacteroidales bacterium]
MFAVPQESKSLVERMGWTFGFEEETKTSERTKRISSSDRLNYRRCPDAFLLKLKELWYSEHTLVAYKSCFEELINYYHQYDVHQIDETSRGLIGLPYGMPLRRL